MLYIRLTETDPRQNLAMEEALFMTIPVNHPGYFLLWQNSPSVIVGRHQNTVEEINQEEVEHSGLPVVRRITGGGAVYHDLGNINFSFVQYRQRVAKIDFSRFLIPIVKALAQVGVTAAISGRNDLEVEGRKISGSAQKILNSRLLHHGTLLVNLDFKAMTRVLHPEPEKYFSKGVPSLRCRVANVSEFWKSGTRMEDLMALLAQVCADKRGGVPEDARALAAQLFQKKYSQWTWNYGESPTYTERRRQRFPCGFVEIRLTIVKGRIRGCRIFGDFFAMREIRYLEQFFIGRSREKTRLVKDLVTLPLEEWFVGCDRTSMAFFLAGLFG